MMDYKKAGVDIEAGYKSVELMKEHVKKTMRAEVLGGLGGFSGAFSLAKIKEMEEPVLLSGTDGCGTKVKLAIIMDKHDTIGIDAVAMCVNDIACAGPAVLCSSTPYQYFHLCSRLSRSYFPDCNFQVVFSRFFQLLPCFNHPDMLPSPEGWTITYLHHPKELSHPSLLHSLFLPHEEPGLRSALPA